jgi:hypothetical protein
MPDLELSYLESFYIIKFNLRILYVDFEKKRKEAKLCVFENILVNLKTKKAKNFRN